MTSLRFHFTARLPGHSAWVRVLVDGKAVVIAKLGSALGLTRNPS